MALSATEELVGTRLFDTLHNLDAFLTRAKAV